MTSRYMIAALASLCVASTTHIGTARTQCESLERLLDMYELSEKRRAGSIEDLRSVQSVFAAYDGDPWGNSYLYEPDAMPRIRSAGPDGKFHTDDDVTAKSRVGFSCVP